MNATWATRMRQSGRAREASSHSRRLAMAMPRNSCRQISPIETMRPRHIRDASCGDRPNRFRIRQAAMREPK